MPSARKPPRATLLGEAHDPSGASIPGAVVRAEKLKQGTHNEAHTNAEGVYFIPFLQPGEYSPAAEHPGFGRFEQTGIKLDVQQALSMDIQLSISSAVTTVQVNGAVSIQALPIP